MEEAYGFFGTATFSKSFDPVKWYLLHFRNFLAWKKRFARLKLFRHYETFPEKIFETHFSKNGFSDVFIFKKRFLGLMGVPLVLCTFWLNKSDIILTILSLFEPYRGTDLGRPKLGFHR